MYIKIYYWGTAEKSKQGVIVLHITINIQEMIGLFCVQNVSVLTKVKSLDDLLCCILEMLVYSQCYHTKLELPLSEPYSLHKHCNLQSYIISNCAGNFLLFFIWLFY